MKLEILGNGPPIATEADRLARAPEIGRDDYESLLAEWVETRNRCTLEGWRRWMIDPDWRPPIGRGFYRVQRALRLWYEGASAKVAVEECGRRDADDA